MNVFSHEEGTSGAVARLEDARRVLLVEFIDLDRFPGQIAAIYPLLKGHCNRLGLAARWIRYGLSTTNLYEHGTDAVTLSPEDLDHLAGAVTEHAPQLVVLTHGMTPEQQDVLLARRDGLRITTVDDLAAAESRRADQDGFGGVLEFRRRGFVPDYVWEPGNEPALRPDRDNIYIWQRANCGYRRSVASNPCYAGVSFGDDTRTLGCAFCGVPTRVLDEDDGSETPSEWITRQLEAVHACREGRAPNALMFESLESVAQLRHVFETLARLGMDAVKALFATRADRLVALTSALTSQIEAVAERGGAIHVHVMGLESFADEELLRFNKGFTGLTALRAVNSLQHLEASYPETFHYSGYRPLAMILFSPWTTLADLELNLGLVERLNIAEELGNVFVARLRMHEDLAITALARRDGLLTRELSDEALRLNRRKLFPNELAWRFVDPRLEGLNSIATRLEGDRTFEEDPLARQLNRWMRTVDLPDGWSQTKHIGLLHALVRAATSDPEPLPFEELFRRAFEAFARREREAAAPREHFRVAADRLDLVAYVRRVACLLGDERSVLSLERVPADTPTRLADACAELGLATAFRREADESVTLYVARDGESAERARVLEEELSQAEASGQREEAAATRRALGRLYGYPECCVSAWANSPWAPTGLVKWALIAARAASPEPLVDGYDPFLVPDASFTCCSAHCAEAARRYREDADKLGLTTPSASLVSLRDDDRATFQPRPLEDDALGFEDVEGDGELAAAMARGDRLRTRSVQVQVAREQKLVTAWTAEVALWTQDRFRAPDEWTEVARAVRRNAPSAEQSARSRAHDSFRQALADPVTRAEQTEPTKTPETPPTDSGAEDIRPEEDILAGLREDRTSGPRLVEAQCGPEPGLALVFDANGERIPLHLGPASDAASAGPDDYVVDYLVARPMEPGEHSTGGLEACLRRLTRLAFPAIREWALEPGFDPEAAAQIRAQWRAHGERLWPTAGEERVPLQRPERAGPAAGGREASLVVSVSGPEGPAATFFVATAQGDQASFRRVGTLRLWHETGGVGPLSRQVARVLAAAMKHLQAHPPSEANLSLWRSAIQELAGRIELWDGYEWQVTWQGS